MKYIVFQDESSILFSESQSHLCMAGWKPVKSAGFCLIETYRNDFDDIRARVSCYGESTTLGVKSNPEDSKILEGLWRQ